MHVRRVIEESQVENRDWNAHNLIQEEDKVCYGVSWGIPQESLTGKSPDGESSLQWDVMAT